jgi:Fic family protein
MSQFIKWFNSRNENDALINAAIAHLWFVTIHPFDDGNGRIARALADMMLARADGMSQRFYSMSAQILLMRKRYYAVLEQTQRGAHDITIWIEWFLNCLRKAIEASASSSENVFAKAKFWERNKSIHFNPRQIKMLNKWFDGFEGKLTSTKWAKMNKCSADTALRDIQDLLSKKILVKDEAGGRSTGYVIKPLDKNLHLTK